MSAWVKADYYAEMIEDYGHVIWAAALSGDQEHFNRLLRNLAEQVNRDTRHKAAEMAQALNNNLINMLMDYMK